MRILVTGNSQAGCLKSAHDLEQATVASVGEMYFFVVPGGKGPSMGFENGRLVPLATAAKFPPYFDPPEVSQMVVDDFDLIVISALGFVDGGFAYPNNIVNEAALAEFGPFGAVRNRGLVSRACFSRMIEHALLSQPGFKFAADLRSVFDKPIMIMPFPHVSEKILERDDWPLRCNYSDPEAAHRFFCRARDAAVRRFCEEHSLELLAYPVERWLDEKFTPHQYMRDKDFIHANLEYGKLALEGIVRAIKSRPAIMPSTHPE